jgi:hypothetical protein
MLLSWRGIRDRRTRGAWSESLRPGAPVFRGWQHIGLTCVGQVVLPQRHGIAPRVRSPGPYGSGTSCPGIQVKSAPHLNRCRSGTSTVNCSPQRNTTVKSTCTFRRVASVAIGRRCDQLQQIATQLIAKCFSRYTPRQPSRPRHMSVSLRRGQAGRHIGTKQTSAGARLPAHDRRVASSLLMTFPATGPMPPPCSIAIASATPNAARLSVRASVSMTRLTLIGAGRHCEEFGHVEGVDPVIRLSLIAAHSQSCYITKPTLLRRT